MRSSASIRHLRAASFGGDGLRPSRAAVMDLIGVAIRPESSPNRGSLFGLGCWRSAWRTDHIITKVRARVADSRDGRDALWAAGAWRIANRHTAARDGMEQGRLRLQRPGSALGAVQEVRVDAPAGRSMPSSSTASAGAFHAETGDLRLRIRDQQKVRCGKFLRAGSA